VILMVVGAIGLLIGLVLLFSERRPAAVVPPPDRSYRPPPEV